MNKKVLFVLHCMSLGGSMTSLLNLLELLKGKGYDIDLLIMDHKGPLMERASRAANLLPENKRIANAMRTLKNPKGAFGFFDVFAFAIRSKLSKGKYNFETVFKKQAKKYSGYDTVVAFQEGLPTYLVKHIECKNKVAWVHSGSVILASEKAISKIEGQYKSFNKIVCVSNVLKEQFTELMKGYDVSISLVYNTLNTELVKSKAREFDVETDKSVLNLISMGRACEVKRFDRAIEAAKRLKADGRSFCWRILGGGELLESLRAKAEAEGVSDVLYFEGAKSNPYPYIAASDCFVLTSVYEAHPMVAIESLVLDKPVLSTDFLSSREVVSHGENGLIGSNDADGVYNNITKIFEDKELFETLKEGALKYDYDNDKILEQVIEIAELKK